MRLAALLLLASSLHAQFTTGLAGTSYRRENATVALATLRTNFLNYGCAVSYHWNQSNFYGLQLPPGNIAIDTYWNPPGIPDIGSWLDSVVASGCKAVFFTVIHQTGFMLWPSKYKTGANVPYAINSSTWYTTNTANGIPPDVTKILVQEARKRNMKIGLYMTIQDLTYEAQCACTAANNTAAYIVKIKAQLREMLTNYGDIDFILTDSWGWDIPIGQYANIPFPTLYNYVKSLQPNVLFMDNAHLHPATNLGGGGIDSDIEVYEEPFAAAGGDVAPGNTRPSVMWRPSKWDTATQETTLGQDDWFNVSCCGTAHKYDGSTTFTPRQLLIDKTYYTANATTYMPNIGPTNSATIPAPQTAMLTGLVAEAAYSTNLSLGKTITSSSHLAGCALASVLNDGVFLTDDTASNLFCSQTGGTDNNPWVEVDLGSVFSVTKASIYNRTDCGFHNCAGTPDGFAGRMRDITFTYYDNSHTLVHTSATLNPSNNTCGNGVADYANGCGVLEEAFSVTARYVRATRAGTGSSDDQSNLALMEFAAYGTPPHFNSRRPATVDHTQVPANQSNFPVLIRGTLDKTHVLASGGTDIAVYTTSAQTTAVPCQLESYDASTGDFTLWATPASISSSADTTMQVFYGNAGVTTSLCTGTGVWDSNFVLVAHLATGALLTDSSTTANTLTNHGTATSVTGNIDGGANLTAASTQYIDAGTNAALDVGAMTMSIWLKPASFPTAYMGVLSKDDGTHDQQILLKSNGKLAVYLACSSSINYDGTGNTTLVAGTWYHIFTAYDSAGGLISYVNGVSDHATVSANGAIATGNTAVTAIGSDTQFPPRYIDGVADEAHISKVARTPNWGITEYNSQKPGSTFLTLGAEVAN